MWIQVTGLLVFTGSKTWRGIFPRNSFVEFRSLAQHGYPSPNRKIREIQYPARLALVWGEELSSPDWPWAKSQVFSSNNEIWISKYDPPHKMHKFELGSERSMNRAILDHRPSRAWGPGFSFLFYPPGIRRRVEWSPGDSGEIRTLGNSWILTALTLTLLCY